MRAEADEELHTVQADIEFDADRHQDLPVVPIAGFRPNPLRVRGLSRPDNEDTASPCQLGF